MPDNARIIVESSAATKVESLEFEGQLTEPGKRVLKGI